MNNQMSDKSPETIFSLRKLAFLSCSHEDQKTYLDYNLPKVDEQKCCKRLLKLISSGKKKRYWCFCTHDDMHIPPMMVCVDNYLAKTAARYGHLDCLMLCHRLGAVGLFDHSVCAEAALYGQLECLIYLHKIGCAWDEDTCHSAAGDGQVSCLKYAHENGCPWDEYTFELAVIQGNSDCINYLQENGCPTFDPVQLGMYCEDCSP